MYKPKGKGRKKGESKLGDLIKELVEAYRWDYKFDEIEIESFWKEQMGPSIARQTEKVFLKKDTLYLKIRSSVLRQELHFSQEKLLDNLNALRPKDKQIAKIVFM